MPQKIKPRHIFVTHDDPHASIRLNNNFRTHKRLLHRIGAASQFNDFSVCYRYRLLKYVTKLFWKRGVDRENRRWAQIAHQFLDVRKRNVAARVTLHKITWGSLDDVAEIDPLGLCEISAPHRIDAESCDWDV